MWIMGNWVQYCDLFPASVYFETGVHHRANPDHDLHMSLWEETELSTLSEHMHSAQNLHAISIVSTVCKTNKYVSTSIPKNNMMWIYLGKLTLFR